MIVDLTNDDVTKLKWILTTPFKEKELNKQSSFQTDGQVNDVVIEIGPRYVFYAETLLITSRRKL